MYIVGGDPITPSGYGGASSLYYDQLMALSELGYAVTLWHYAEVSQRRQFDRVTNEDSETWNRVKASCKSVILTDYCKQDNYLRRALSRVRRLASPWLHPPHWQIDSDVGWILRLCRPDFIWAQHFEPALLALIHRQERVVYVHHDWLYRIKALRSHGRESEKRRRLEERVVQRAAVVISGSAVECKEINRAGARHVFYIPVSYEKTDLHVNRLSGGKPRVVHLGGMGTTANRDGLLAFFEKVWPALGHMDVELEVVGETESAPPALAAHLKKVQCHGFVRNLSTVLRPFDLHIIPWEHATGQRTRLPLAFNHAQVVIATRASVACYPEARDGSTCFLVERLEDMGPLLIRLLGDESERRRIGLAAREEFEKSFTRSGLLSRYQIAVASVLEK